MDIGFGRDEGYYFRAGELYARWFDEHGAAWGDGEPLRPFSQAVVDEHWAYNPEHPIVYKTLFGLSWRLLGRMEPPAEGVSARVADGWYLERQRPAPILGWLDESTAFRLPTAVTAALLLWLLYLFGAEGWDRRTGLAAAALFATMPRAFYHSHLAAFDLPITFWTLLTVYTFWRSLRGGWGAAFLCGLVWGVSLGVKLNAFFTPFFLGGWWLVAHWRDFGVQRGGRLGIRVRLPRIPRAFFAMALLGPLLFVGLWPRHWFDTVARISWYVQRHWNHEYYWAYYFGRLLTKPPFPVAFPFAMSAVTIPATTLALFVAGLVRALWPGPYRGRDGVAGLCLVAMLVPFVLIAMPGTPVFGGTKHWLPGVPFLALFAGVAFTRLCDAVQGLVDPARTRLRGLATAALVALFVAPSALAVARSHPDEVAYYNELIGGMAGMGEHGMQREFWGSTAGSVLPWVNEHLPKNASVHWHDTNHDAFRLYKRDGRARPDLRYTWRAERSQYALYHWHKEFLEVAYDIEQAYHGGVPHHVYARDGVPLLVVYGPPPPKAKP